MNRLSFLLVCCSFLMLIGNACSPNTDASTPPPDLQVEAPKASPSPTNEKPRDTSSPLMDSESYKRIAAILPQTVKGVKGGPFEGWAPGVTPGVKFTFAKRAYRDYAKKTRIDLSIADAGTESLSKLGLTNYWLGKDLDRKTEQGGTEKTRQFNNYPAFERCEKGACDVYFVIGERYLIGGHIANLPVEQMYEVFQTVDWSALSQ